MDAFESYHASQPMALNLACLWHNHPPQSCPHAHAGGPTAVEIRRLVGEKVVHACIVDQSQQGVPFHFRPDLCCCLVNRCLIGDIKNQRCVKVPKLPLQPFRLLLCPHTAFDKPACLTDMSVNPKRGSNDHTAPRLQKWLRYLPAKDMALVCHKCLGNGIADTG